MFSGDSNFNFPFTSSFENSSYDGYKSHHIYISTQIFISFIKRSIGLNENANQSVSNSMLRFIQKIFLILLSINKMVHKVYDIS